MKICNGLLVLSVLQGTSAFVAQPPKATSFSRLASSPSTQQQTASTGTSPAFPATTTQGAPASDAPASDAPASDAPASDAPAPMTPAPTTPSSNARPEVAHGMKNPRARVPNPERAPRSGPTGGYEHWWDNTGRPPLEGSTFSGAHNVGPGHKASYDGRTWWDKSGRQLHDIEGTRFSRAHNVEPYRRASSDGHAWWDNSGRREPEGSTFGGAHNVEPYRKTYGANDKTWRDDSVRAVRDAGVNF